MATAETWGVDQTYVQSMTGEHVKIADSVDAMITTTRLAAQTNRAASRVNTIIAGVLGTGAVATLVANKTATQEGASAYATVQGCVMDFLWPILLPATHGMPPTSEVIDEIEERVRLKVEDLRTHPEDLGTPNVEDYAGRAETSVNYSDLDTTTEPGYRDSYTQAASGRWTRNW